MWTSHPAGLSDQTDELARLQLLALHYRDFAEVGVETDQPLAVVNENRVTVKVKFPRFHDNAVGGCVYRDAGWCRYVQPAMAPPSGLIVNSHQSKLAAEPTGQWQLELAGGKFFTP